MALEQLRSVTPLSSATAGRFDGIETSGASGRKILRGAIIAEAVEFRTGRGVFDMEALRSASRLMNAMRRRPARLDHAGPHNDLGLLRYLGEWENIRVEGTKLRGDLVFSAAADRLPGLGDVAGYILTVARENPEAIGISLALYAEKIPRGHGQPPAWYPTEIMSADVVGIGDATRSLLDSAGKSTKQLEAEAAAKRGAECRALIAKAQGTNYKPTRHYTRAEAIAKVDAILRSCGR